MSIEPPAVDGGARRAPGPEQPLPMAVDNATLVRLRDLCERYGDIVRIPQPGGRWAYFINDAQAVREILVRRHQGFRKGRGFERVKMLLGNGLIVSDGQHWRRSRTMIQPSFKPRQIHTLTDHMVRCARRLERQWSDCMANAAPLNITKETSDFALELILISIFGEELADVPSLADDPRFAFLAPNAGRDLEMVKRVRELRQWISAVIAKRRTNDSQQDDFLGLYLHARDKDGQPFSERELLDEMITLIVAGFETSANTLNWVWYLLADAPDVIHRILDEIERETRGGLELDAASAWRQ
ncbi:MAG: cytochrome P450, partial [Pseudomonadota bacterium]